MICTSTCRTKEVSKQFEKIIRKLTPINLKNMKEKLNDYIALMVITNHTNAIQIHVL